MELDDLKNTWKDVGNEVNKHQNIKPSLIQEMTSTKYHLSLKKIVRSEIAGVVICFVAAAFVALHFASLNTAYLKGAGGAAVLLLLAVPVISLVSIRQLTIASDITKSYVEMLKEFAHKKIRFYKLQKLNVLLCYLLLITIIILLPKFFGGKDITGNKYFWTFSFSGGYIFLLFYSWQVAKFYKRTLCEAEELLKELKS